MHPLVPALVCSVVAYVLMYIAAGQTERLFSYRTIERFLILIGIACPVIVSLVCFSLFSIEELVVAALCSFIGGFFCGAAGTFASDNARKSDG